MMKWLVLALASSALALKMEGSQKNDGVHKVYEQILKTLAGQRKEAVQTFRDVAQEYQSEAVTCHEQIEQLKSDLNTLNGQADSDANSLSTTGDGMAAAKLAITGFQETKAAEEELKRDAAKLLAENDQACASTNQDHRAVLKTFRNAIKTYKSSRNAIEEENTSAGGLDRGANAKQGGALVGMLEGLQEDARKAYKDHTDTCATDRNTHTEDRTDAENEINRAEQNIDAQQRKLDNLTLEFNELDENNRADLKTIAEKQDEYKLTLDDCAADTKENNFEYAEARSIANQAAYLHDMVANQKSTLGFVQTMAKHDPLVNIVNNMLAKFPKDQALVQAAEDGPVGVDRKNPFVNIMKIIETKIHEVHAANEKDKSEYAACEQATSEAEKSRDGHRRHMRNAEGNFHTAYDKFFKARVQIHGLELQHARTMENFERAKYFRLVHNMENESMYIVASKVSEDLKDIISLAGEGTPFSSVVKSVQENVDVSRKQIIGNDLSEDNRYAKVRNGYKLDVQALKTEYSDRTNRFTDNKARAKNEWEKAYTNAVSLDTDATRWNSGGDVHNKCEDIKISFEDREAARQKEIQALEASLKAMQSSL